MKKRNHSSFKQLFKSELESYNESHGSRYQSSRWQESIEGYSVWQSNNKLGFVRDAKDGIWATSIRGKGSEQKKFPSVKTALVWVIETATNNTSSVFCFFQPNPAEGNKCTKGDCAIRAMCKALDIDWRTAMTELCKWAIEHYCIPNSLNDTLKPYLLENGYKFVGAGKERPTAAEFAKSHPTGTYYLYVQSGYQTHAMTLKDGIVYDAWDSTGCHLYGFFTKE